MISVTRGLRKHETSCVRSPKTSQNVHDKYMAKKNITAQHNTNITFVGHKTITLGLNHMEKIRVWLDLSHHRCTIL